MEILLLWAAPENPLMRSYPVSAKEQSMTTCLLPFYLQSCCGAQGPPSTILLCQVTGTVHRFSLIPWTPEHNPLRKVPSQPLLLTPHSSVRQVTTEPRIPHSSSSLDKHWQQLAISSSLDAGKMKCCSSLNDIWILGFKSWSGIWKYPENRIIFMKQKFILPASSSCQDSLLKIRPSVMETGI